ncbi:MAG: hypothetical protein WBB57_26160 [Mycobacterium sp.]
MSEPTAAEIVASSQVGQHYGAALDTLRSTVKWLVASAGAVAAAIIAGAQLVDYSDRNWAGATFAALAVAVSLALTLTLLARAAKILTVPRPTATDLANAELRAGAVDPAKRASGQITDTDVQWLLARATYLLGPHDTVHTLLAEYDRAISTASANDADARAEQLRKQVELNRRIGLVEEAAHYRDMSSAYNELIGSFKVGATAFIAAVIVFAGSGLLRPGDEPQQPANQITKPIPVRVVTTTAHGTDPHPDCLDREGMAIGGTLTSPTVVVNPTPSCAAETIEPSRPGLVVIPKVPSE